jgi:hypothetical protein
MINRVEKKEVNQDCAKCLHPFDPHVLVSTTETDVGEVQDVPVGGIILCPEPGCECFATWDVPQLGTQREDVIIPTDEELISLRRYIQGSQPQE